MRPRLPGLPRRRVAAAWVLALLFSVGWSLACNLLLEYPQSGRDLSVLLEDELQEHPDLFLVGGALVWCAFVLLWAVSSRLWVAAAATLMASMVLAYANARKLDLRAEPLYPGDLAFAREARFLTDMVGARALLTLALLLVLVATASWWLGRRLRRHWPRADVGREAPRRKAPVVARCAAVVVTATVLLSASQFNQDDNPVRATFENAGAKWAFWFQKLNYQRNGFVAGMLYNLDVPAMSRPDGYDEAAMRSLTERYARKARLLNADREPAALADTNVVLVLSEAFTDPTLLTGATFDTDPIPATRDLMGRTTSGTMLAQLFGGGTANMEFEVLTGMSLSQFTPQMQTPYQMLVPGYSDFPSAVGLLAQDGHRPIAVHPYMTSMYQREQVYPILGFEEFLGEDEIDDPERIDDSDFISDASAFSQVTHEIAASDEPLLVNLVTMQNHYPMEHLYTDPMYVTGLDGDAQDEAGGYGRGLAHTDAALQDFLADLEASDEDTAVVFYGDHQPAFWPEDVREENGDVAMRSTPFFLWADEGLDKRATAALTSPIYFLPMLYDALGAELPPYYALLLELQQEIPAMEQGLYLDETGEPMAEDDLSSRARRLLRDYRLVQYDLSVGARYSQDELFYPADLTSAASE